MTCRCVNSVVICAAAFALVSSAVGSPARAEKEDASSRYYFDHGAEQFTRDDIAKARAWVEEGLLLYPADTKLLMLRQLLEQPPPQPQPQSSPENSNQSNGEDKSEQNDAEEQQEASPAEANEEQAASSDEEARPAAAMTPEEAERVLDSLRDREAAARARIAADRLRREMARHPPVEKDW